MLARAERPRRSLTGATKLNLVPTAREVKGRTWCPLSGQRCEWRRRRSGQVRHRSDPLGRCGLSPEAGGFWGVYGYRNILAGAAHVGGSYYMSGVGFRIGPCECLAASYQRTSKIREASNTIERAWGAPEPTLPHRPIDRHPARQIRSRLEYRRRYRNLTFRTRQMHRRDSTAP